MRVAGATLILVAIQFLSFFWEKRTCMHTRSVVVTVAKNWILYPRNGGRVNTPTDRSVYIHVNFSSKESTKIELRTECELQTQLAFWIYVICSPHRRRVKKFLSPF